jgi:hypothetical protein
LGIIFAERNRQQNKHSRERLQIELNHGVLGTISNSQETDMPLA